MSQTQKLKDLMLDGEPHRTDEIVRIVYGAGMSLARVGARIYDLKNKFNLNIIGWHDSQNPKLYWYQITPGGQTESRAAHNREIAGSIPAPATNLTRLGSNEPYYANA